MAIIYRHEKGAPLTAQEIDGNFRELETRLDALTDHAEPGEGLGKIHVEDDQVTFTGAFGTHFGTFTLPKVNLNLPPPLPPPDPSPILPLYERATLPPTDIVGKVALLFEGENTTLIFFNGNNWQCLIKGEKL